ncbi:class I SAM-dependent DNA methyltransferase [Brevundimonas lutea]|uniref:class I SAM-dependent DNA methyltransferase n=1 Tax=Brevundimonas lutea TaxID=2293980 RepID=UPI000F042050|nr:SAM-dependent methyltransferase [Brevundimonas lutea]
MGEASLPRRYFEDIFEGDTDPWGLASRDYERRKFDRSLSALAGRRYERGLEVGCAGGVLTERLATTCSSLVAVDISARAIGRAAERLAPLGNVRLERMDFPGTRPVGAFDLMVLSEVAYYWSDGDLDRCAAFVRESLERGGDLLLVHYTGPTDYPQTADGATDRLWTGLSDILDRRSDERRARYRLDLWRRRC